MRLKNGIFLAVFIPFIIALGMISLKKSIASKDEVKFKASGTILLFQEQVFSLPSDKFFITNFNNGKCDFIKNLNLEKVLDTYGDDLSIYLNNKLLKGFILHKWDNYNYILLYFKNQEGIYENILVDRNKKMILKKFSSAMVWGSTKDALFFVDGNFILFKYNFKNNLIDQIANEVSAFISDPDEKFFLIFDTNGDLIMNTDPSKKLPIVKKIGGITTESGLINRDWGWFYKRVNEYSRGYLSFINIRTSKIIKCKAKITQIKLIKMCNLSDS